MNDLQHIYDVTEEDFQTAVVERSQQVPVLVDYWADWCGPCQMQMPILMKLVGEYDGQVLLAKVNTEEQRGLARDHGIRSLPTMRLYKDGSIVEEILGAQTEGTLRNLLDKYVARASDQARAAAMESWRQGNATEALKMLGEAHDADPDNHRIMLDTARIKLDLGEFDAVEIILNALPRDIREEPGATRLYALLGFARIAADAPAPAELETRVAQQPHDLQARYRLAAHHALNEQLEPAMQELLYILQHDRAFGDDAGRKGLLAVFELLDNEGELVADYRRKLFNSMH